MAPRAAAALCACAAFPWRRGRESETPPCAPPKSCSRRSGGASPVPPSPRDFSFVVCNVGTVYHGLAWTCGTPRENNNPTRLGKRGAPTPGPRADPAAGIAGGGRGLELAPLPPRAQGSVRVVYYICYFLVRLGRKCQVLVWRCTCAASRPGSGDRPRPNRDQRQRRRWTRTKTVSGGATALPVAPALGLCVRG